MRQVEPSYFVDSSMQLHVWRRGLWSRYVTSPLWATLLRIKLFEKYGTTMAYRVGNVLLNVPRGINGRTGMLPELVVDSCHNMGYLDAVEQRIKRRTGLSMSDIGKDIRYGFGWLAGFAYSM